MLENTATNIFSLQIRQVSLLIQSVKLRSRLINAWLYFCRDINEVVFSFDRLNHQITGILRL